MFNLCIDFYILNLLLIFNSLTAMSTNMDSKVEQNISQKF